MPLPSYRTLLVPLLPFLLTNALRADVVISEILYDSEPNTACDEFIELHNSGAGEVDLSGWYFSDGIEFVVPAGTALAPGGFLVIAQDPSSLTAIHGTAALGPWAGGLSNEGETVELRDAAGSLVDEVTYRDSFPWPVGALGSGRSIELINPSLDNDLGGAWRASQPPPVLGELTYFSAASQWSYRRGTSEPSADWNTSGFVEGADWLAGQTPIGFGNAGQTLNTPLADMQNVHSSVYARHSFQVAAGEIPQALLLRHNVDDGFIAFINGLEVARVRADGIGAFDDTASSSQSPEGEWAEIELAGGAVVEGENVLAIIAYNGTRSSSDYAFDFELIRPAIDAPAAVPTPGKVNSDYAQNAAPNIRQVDHDPKQPTTSETTIITAKVTDADGVDSVLLEYQVVKPGHYIEAFIAKSRTALEADPNGPREPNPEFHNPANWATVPMVDDGTGGDAVAGDSVYSATLDVFGEYPPDEEKNRTLVRYRITVEDLVGASVRVPYEDDPSLNFAYYVYDGVPDYIAETQSVTGQVPYTHPKEVMTALPVYAMLTTQADFDQCVAYNSSDRISANPPDARSAFNWSGTFVYDGVVYDNIGYRLRQRNGRYAGSGKRSFRFRFNNGQHIQLHDNDGKPYPTRWRSLNSHKGTSSRAGVLNMGLYEAANAKLWNMTGSPAPYAHWFHFRVVKSEQEQPAGTNGQHLGDFYGMLLAMEDYDVRFLESHDLGRGNLYKLKTGGNDGLSVQRYQAKDAVDDGTDFTNIINQLRDSKSDEWLREHVNWEVYYKYKVIVDAVRTYDVSNGITPNNSEHLKNRSYFFEPEPGNEFGKLHLLPWDSDTSWGPNWNGGWDWPKSAMSDREEFNKEYKNVVREFRDLVWQEDQINPMLDSFRDMLDAFHTADRDKWTNAPNPSGSSDPGRQNDPAMSVRIEDMKKYAFEGGNWDGGGSTMRDYVYTDNGDLVADGNISRDGGITGGAEVDKGRDAYLDLLAYDPSVPTKPTISYEGDPGYPVDGLAFRASAFDDPQGVETFSAMEWRVAEITPLGGGTVNFFDSGQTWRFLDDGTDQGVAWRDSTFDDASWGQAGAPFGWGGISSSEGSVVLETALTRGVTQYFRRTVEVPDPDLYENFTFKIQADDGVLVFVNGVEVVRDGFQELGGGDVTYDTLSIPAVAGTDEGAFDSFEVPSEMFLPGTNIIAAELHQSSTGSSDAVFDMALEATERTIPVGASLLFEWDADWESGELGVPGVPPLGDDLAIDLPSTATREGRVYRARVRYKDDTERWSNWSDPVQFTTSLPDIQPLLDHLVISEFMYHPPTPIQAEVDAGFTDQDEFEFIELQNVSASEALSLTDVRFTKGIDFDFPAGTMMAPGDYLLVVRNRAAFELRYGNSLPIAGEYLGSAESNLSNGGERLKLSFGGGVPIRDFEYDDNAPWPAAADGEGSSLVLLNPSSVPDHALATNWTASATSGGSPGQAGEDGLTLEDWLASFGINEPEPDPAFDGDQDGLSQFLEFALAGDPTRSLPSERPQAGTVEIGGEEYLTITFDRQSAADGVIYSVEFSGDLSTWRSDGLLVSATPGPGNRVTETWRAATPVTAEGNRYARVRVSQ